MGIKTGSTGDEAWPTDKYLNIWLCDFKDETLGYSSFPEDLSARPNFDGVVINTRSFGRVGNVLPPYDKGRTTTHEIGHWLGLRHIWGDETCGNDFVFDTPTQQGKNTGCPSFPKTSACNGNGFNGDMFMNYMDYTDDICMNAYSNGQRQRGRGCFIPNGPRFSIIENSFKVMPRSTPIYCSGKIKLLNRTCLSNVNWFVVSGNATITASNDLEATVSSPITGNITIRATAGNYISEQTYQVSQETPTFAGISYNNGLTSGNMVMWYDPSRPLASVNDMCIGFGFPNRYVEAIPFGSSENEVVWTNVNITPQSGFSIYQQSNNRAYINFAYNNTPTGYLQGTISGCGTYSRVVAFKQVNCNPGGNPCDAATGQKFYTVSPNPATDQITIGISNRTAPVDCNTLRSLTTTKGICFSSVNIYSNSGVLMKSFKTTSSKNATIQIGNLITGNYIVEIIEGDYIEKQNLIVQ